jgi:hypothetical protein
VRIDVEMPLDRVRLTTGHCTILAPGIETSVARAIASS